MKLYPTPSELVKAVDRIIAVAGDDEQAHSLEDELHRRVIAAFCPIWVTTEIQRLSNADFHRWCA